MKPQTAIGVALHQNSRISFLLRVIPLCLFLTACATTQEPTQASISLPIIGGWFEGQKVYYLTTDISEINRAKAMGANYAPRLKDAILPRPKPPGIKSAVERVYVFPNGEQGSVLPSSPTPLGHTSKDKSYSPIWQLYEVNYITQPSEVLKSEESLFKAEDKGLINIRRTEVVVNCPVVMTGNESLGLSQHRQPQSTSRQVYSSQ